MTDSKPCPALVCSCGNAPFTPQTRAGRSLQTLLALVGQDAIKRGVARPLPAPEAEHGWYDKPDPVPNPARERCPAKTRHGAPCHNYAQPGGKFCWYHSGQDPFAHAADVIDREAEQRRVDVVLQQAAKVTEFAMAVIDELGLDRKRAAGVLRRLAGGIDSENLPQPGGGDPDVPPDA